MKNLLSKELLIASLLVVIAVASRFIPGLNNFSPIYSLALFAGMTFKNRTLAFAVPISAMLISDFMIGFHSDLASVYIAFAAMVGIGLYLKDKSSFLTIGLGSLVSALVFFVFTNFSVWAFNDWYSHDLQGLATCFDMALPFFRPTVISSLLYSIVLFAAYKTSEKFVLKPIA